MKRALVVRSTARVDPALRSFSAAISEIQAARVEVIEAAKVLGLHVPHPRWERGSPARRSATRLRAALKRLRAAQHGIDLYCENG